MTGRTTGALVVTQFSLDRVGWMISALMFPVAGVWFALGTPTGLTSGGVVAGLVCFAVAVCMLFLRERTGPSSVARWVLPPLAMVALAVIQLLTGSSNWLATELAAIGALVTAAMESSVLRSLLSSGVTILATSLAGRGAGSDERLAQVVSMYLLALGGVVAFRRVAQRVDRAGVQSERTLAVQLAEASTSGARAAVQRVLHDTVLNTLEAVANGIPADRWGQLRRRCASDLQAVAHIADPETSRQLADFIDEMLESPVPINTDVQWFADPPPLVREAVLAATGEAIRNATRHSEADVVELRARVSSDALLVEVVDHGVGFDVPVQDRLGLRTSITATMESVEGYAVVDSAPGEGTTVSIVWDALRARVSGVLLHLRRRMLLLLAAISAVTLMGYLLGALLDPQRPEQSAVLLVIAITAALVAFLAFTGLRAPIAGWEFVVGLLGMVAITFLVPLGDPACTTAQSTSPLDLRSTAALVLALAVGSVRQMVVSVIVVVGASGLANAMWIQLGSSCGWTYFLTSWVAAGLAVAAFGFARTLESRRSDLAGVAVSQEQEVFAEAHNQGRLSEMAEWNSIQVTQALGLLQQIEAGEQDSPHLRKRARAVAAQVRQWLLLIGTSGPVPRTIKELLRHWPQAPTVLIDGDPRSVDDASASAQEAATRLDDWIARVPGSTVRITVSRTSETASVLVCSDRPGACEDPDSWSDEDGWWLHLTWASVAEGESTDNS